MRVIAGSLGGRQFTSPHSRRIHPMSEKLRGAIFNALGDINSLNVLDAFAGSGALSYEAVSRGAKHVVAVDVDKSAQQNIDENIATLGIKNISLIKARALVWLRKSDENFDVVLCDPPYDDIDPRLLRLLAERVKPGGIFVLSLPPNANINFEQKYKLITNKVYGDASLKFYRRALNY